ncbi:MAG TPA: glycerol kinase, partial [Nitrospiraceae bacterium]|nr:glycerol kinase [Nitrospiraceae bacterium]
MGQYILVLDQGISGSRAILVDSKGKIITSVECPLKPVFPKPGLVEYKPGDILKSQLNAIKTLFRKIGSKKKQISAIGITNQPSTIILWDKSTGKPVYNAIAYQDTRGADLCRERSVQRDMV